MALIRYNRIKEGHDQAEVNAATTVAELEELVVALVFFCPICERPMMGNIPPKIKQARTLKEMRAIKACGACLSGEDDADKPIVKSAQQVKPSS
jgi:hypothetical protein